MQRNFRRVASLAPFLFALACASAPPPTTSLQVGSYVAAATLMDQNDVSHAIDESVRIVFFAREMEGGAVIRALLAEEEPDYLSRMEAVYVADISGMPRVIANMVAIPKMRNERPYSTLLDREGATTAAFPSEEGRVTIVALDELRVTAIHYRDSVEGIREVVAEVAAPR